MSGVDYRTLMHATSQIIQMIETSKANMDEMLDELPAGFSLVSPKGQIFRANRMLASFFGLQMQQCLNRSFLEIFDDLGQERISSAIREACSTGESQKLELMSKPLREGESGRMVQWSVSPVGQKEANGYKLLALLGNDVSELRNTQSKIADLFNTLPVGIMSVTPNGKVADVYTGSCTHLLGRKELVGESILSLIHQEENNRFSNAQLRALKALNDFNGMSDVTFEAFRESAPSEFKLVFQNDYGTSHRYIGVIYQPIVSRDTVTRVLLLIQDRTALVEARERDNADREAETKSIKRILQVKRVAPDVLPIFLEEITSLMSRTGEVLKARKPKDLAAVLHGVKGNSRVARFETLGKMAHDLEERLLAQGAQAIKDEDWVFVEKEIRDMEEEWSELSSLATALLTGGGAPGGAAASSSGGAGDLVRTLRGLMDSYQASRVNAKGMEVEVAIDRVRLALAGVSLTEASSLELWLRTGAGETASAVGREIELTVDWGSVLLDESSRKCLTETLLHLVNNAIDHGIESPEVRKETGKPAKGKIQVQLIEEDGRIHGIVKDDGAGIDARVVKLKAIRMGLINGDTSRTMSHRDALALIFESGLSTRDKVTAVSGRGVGLSAVKDTLKAMGGNFTVDSEPGKGTQFDFWIEYASPIHQQRRLIPHATFMTELKDTLEFMSQKQGCPVEVSEWTTHPELTSGMLYCNPRHLVIALSQKILELGRGKTVALDVAPSSDSTAKGEIILEVRTGVGLAPEQQSREPSAEFTATPHVTNRIIASHKGVVKGQSGAGGAIVFQEKFQRQDLPSMGVHFDADVTSSQASAHRKWVEAFCNRSGVHLADYESATLKIRVSSEVRSDEFDAIPIQSDEPAFEVQLLRVLNRNMGFDQ